LAGALRNREPELLKQLFVHIETPEAEARALTIAWQINRPEAVSFLAGGLKAPKGPETFPKALDAPGWMQDQRGGEGEGGGGGGRHRVGPEPGARRSGSASGEDRL